MTGPLVRIFGRQVAHEGDRLVVGLAIDHQEGEAAGGTVLEDIGVGVVLARQHVDRPALVGDAGVVEECLIKIS